MRSGIKKLTARTVVVTTKTDQSLRGALTAVHSDSVTLSGPMILTPDAETDGVSLGGDVLIPLANVNFIQVVAPAAV